MGTVAGKGMLLRGFPSLHRYTVLLLLAAQNLHTQLVSRIAPLLIIATTVLLAVLHMPQVLLLIQLVSSIAPLLIIATAVLLAVLHMPQVLLLITR